MDNPGLPKELWSHLDGRLWHATERVGVGGIVADGKIRVAFGNRYAGSFCRNQEGVSLFDFGPASEDIYPQFDNWCGWFGHQQGTRVAVWLEIDRAAVQKNLMDAKEVREAVGRRMDKRRAEGKTHEPGIQFIPGVEACHSGSIPLKAMNGVLLVDQHNRNLSRLLDGPCTKTVQQVDAFEATLPPYQKNPMAQALRDARQKAFQNLSEE